MAPVEEATVFLAKQCYQDSLRYFEDAVKCMKRGNLPRDNSDCVRRLLITHQEFIKRCHTNKLQ